MKITQKQKIEYAIKQLTVSYEMGLPLPYDIIGGTLVVSRIDGNSPYLDTYTRQEMIEYFDENLQEYYEEDHEDC